MAHTDLLIRRATVSDAASIAQFAERTFLEAFGAENEPEHLREYLPQAYGVEIQARELTDPSVTYLLAVLGSTLVGYSMIRHKEPPACVTDRNALEVH